MCQQSVKQHMLQLNEMATGRQFSLKSYFSATPTFEISGTSETKISIDESDEMLTSNIGLSFKLDIKLVWVKSLANFMT